MLMIIGLFVFVVCFFAALGGLMAIFAGNVSAGLIAMAIGLTPFAFLRFKVVRQRERFAAIHADMLKAAGLRPGSGWDHMENDSGVAINVEARAITMASGGKIMTYPLSEVREWSTNLATAGQVFIAGGGLAGALSAGAANVAAGRRADAATGFFVTVRDIQNPRWRIQMSKAADQAKWMEIMEQTVNEGRVVA